MTTVFPLAGRGWLSIALAFGMLITSHALFAQAVPPMLQKHSAEANAELKKLRKQYLNTRSQHVEEHILTIEAGLAYARGMHDAGDKSKATALIRKLGRTIGKHYGTQSVEYLKLFALRRHIELPEQIARRGKFNFHREFSVAAKVYGKQSSEYVALLAEALSPVLDSIENPQQLRAAITDIDARRAWYMDMKTRLQYPTVKSAINLSRQLTMLLENTPSVTVKQLERFYFYQGLRAVDNPNQRVPIALQRAYQLGADDASNIYAQHAALLLYRVQTEASERKGLAAYLKQSGIHNDAVLNELAMISDVDAALSGHLQEEQAYLSTFQLNGQAAPKHVALYLRYAKLIGIDAATAQQQAKQLNELRDAVGDARRQSDTPSDDLISAVSAYIDYIYALPLMDSATTEQSISEQFTQHHQAFMLAQANRVYDLAGSSCTLLIKHAETTGRDNVPQLARAYFYRALRELARGHSGKVKKDLQIAIDLWADGRKLTADDKRLLAFAMSYQLTDQQRERQRPAMAKLQQKAKQLGVELAQVDDPQLFWKPVTTVELSAASEQEISSLRDGFKSVALLASD